MKKERKLLRVADLQLNEGQLGWLPKNPRQWTQDDIDKTAASIDEDKDFLEERPILVIPIPGTGDFVVFCGNLRREGAKAAGLVKVPCVVHYPETEDDREAVLRRSLKDNGSFGRFDWDEMANNPVWGKFDAASFGIPVWQQEGGEGDQPGVGGTGGGEAHEDDFDEGSDEIHVRCKKGDIWQLGEHRLMCGDSTDENSMALLMNGKKAEVVFTSPPYNGDNAMPQEHIAKGVKTTSQRLYNKGYKDNLESDAYIAFCSKVLDLCFQNTDGFIFWNVNYNAKSRYEYISQIVTKLPYLIEQICWKKHGSIPFKGSMKRIWEPIYLFSTNGERLGLDKCEENFWEVNNQNNNYADHNACFPVALVGKALSILTDRIVVLDPFGGSGTTLIACEQLGRECYVMELDPHYCDVIIARWEKETGKTAIRLN